VPNFCICSCAAAACPLGALEAAASCVPLEGAAATDCRLRIFRLYSMWYQTKGICNHYSCCESCLYHVQLPDGAYGLCFFGRLGVFHPVIYMCYIYPCSCCLSGCMCAARPARTFHLIVLPGVMPVGGLLGLPPDSPPAPVPGSSNPDPPPASAAGRRRLGL
jgi:hypothetical protein